MLGIYSQLLLYCYAAGATILVAGFLYLGISIYEWYNKEPIIRYDIDVPTPPSNGKALEKPSIKV